jgi:putative ABC transport system permease protein
VAPFKLVRRNLFRRPLRTSLTVLSLTVAIFLICGLRTLITTLTAGVEHADSRRLAVMSSTGLFVELPLSYQQKIDAVPGVEKTTKFQWFGGYYRSMKGFFAQFAIDGEAMFSMYPECEITPEQQASFLKTRNGCIVGDALCTDSKFGFQLGQTIQINSPLHPMAGNKAWDFVVCGIYHSKSPNFDNRTLFFHWEYFEEALKGEGHPPGVGVYAIRVKPDADIPGVIGSVKELFENGPQRVDCNTEAEFQRQFVTMFGNLPLFVGWIGTGVLIAIFLACVNTMVMAMREQLSEIGILKSLGFTDASTFGLLILQSFTLCCAGGALGLAVAWATQDWVSNMLGTNFPGYHITSGTFVLAAVVAMLLGLFTGVAPAWRVAKLRCVEALRSVE